MERFSEIFVRDAHNPILKSSDWPYLINAVFNPGATIFDGKVLLLVRVEDRRGFSHLVPVYSKDGITGWDVHEKETLYSDGELGEEEAGLEDPRIVYLPSLKEYVITYTAFTYGGATVSLATTKDFKSYNKIGPLVPPEDKDAAIFPKLFNNRFLLIHRPIVRGAAHIWICSSPDLKHWGEHSILITARPGMWDCHRVGLGPPPIETEEGWLMLYHGVRTTTAGAIYRVGAALLDKDNPQRVIARSKSWLFGPEADYENRGDVPGVIFPTGAIVRDGILYMYYGAADTTVCLATAKIKDICDFLKYENRE